jgi:thymidylate synthase
MEQYLSHVRTILSDEESAYRPSRTGVDTISCFDHHSVYDLGKGFPLITTKKLATNAIFHELLWFLRGETNIKYLVDNNVHIWDEWADADGNLGPVYGRQWRAWETMDGRKVDQIDDLITLLKKNPDSRRMIVSAWNPGDVPKMALPPCHTLWQVYAQDGKLSLKLYQRSADMFLGVPFNIASYALLTHILAAQADLAPSRFIHTFGDAHLYCGSGERGAFYRESLPWLKRMVADATEPDDYLAIREDIERYAPAEAPGHEREDHVPLALTQLAREPRDLPHLHVTRKPIEALTIDDIVLSDYDPHPGIKGKVAV